MAKKSKYEELANSVVSLVGEKQNIINFTHCVTRLRFNIKDKSLVKVAEIEKIQGVVGCQWSGEQLQIIIGQAVGDVYQLICSKTGLEKNAGVNENLETPKKKIGISLLFESIAGCMIPLLPMLIGVGMLKIVIIILNTTGLLAVESTTNLFLNFVTDAGFYFLPVFVGMTSAKKFGANQGLGMLLGAMLIHPQFIANVTGGNALSLFGLPIYAGSYTNTIFPVIMSVYIMAKFEKAITKYIPVVLRSIAVPVATLIIMIPLMFCLIAPAGAYIGTYLAIAVQWMNNVMGPLGIAILAAMFPFLVLTGMHTALIPYGLQAYSTLGYMPNAIATLISNINQGAATAAVAFKTKDKNLKATALSCTATAVLAGVTEPAMFGVNLRYKKPMIGVVIGSFCGGLFAGIFQVHAYSFGATSGLFAFPGYMGAQGINNVIFAILSVIVGFVVTFVVTYLLFKDEVIED